MQLCTYHKRIYQFDIAIIHNYLRDKTQVGRPTASDIERTLCQMSHDNILGYNSDSDEHYWYLHNVA